MDKVAESEEQYSTTSNTEIKNTPQIQEQKIQTENKKYVDEDIEVSKEILNHPISKSIFENFDGYIFNINLKK